MAARSLLAAALLCSLQALPALAQRSPAPPPAPAPAPSPSTADNGNGSAELPFDAATADNITAFFSTSPSPSGPSQFGATGNVTRLQNTGTGTTSYSPEPLPPTGAVSLACSLGYLSPAFEANYVGVSSAFYNKGYGCGQCIQLQCDDQGCQQLGKRMTAMVVDLCGDCYDADISIATPLFANLTGMNTPSAQVSWKWVPCGDLIQGNIKMMQKPGGTAYYQAFSFSNTRQPVIAVRMNNQLLKRSASGNWWEWNPGQAINPAGPFKLDLLGANKQVISVTLPALRPTDLGKQFSG